MYKLTIHLADGSSFEQSLEGPLVRLGRKKDNNIVIRDKHISGFHAEFHQQSDGTYEVRDLESHNGIYIDNKKVNAQILKDGDRLKLGVINIDVRLDSSGAKDKPAGPVVKRLSPDRESQPAQPAPPAPAAAPAKPATPPAPKVATTPKPASGKTTPTPPSKDPGTAPPHPASATPKPKDNPKATPAPRRAAASITPKPPLVTKEP
ncbi:MAG: FHA domain-containing protein, partial [Verrucomicrobiota bacterium]